MGDNPTTFESETNLDVVCQLDQEQLDSFRSQRDNDEDYEDKEETWEPEDHHTNAFDVSPLITSMMSHLCKILNIFWTRYVMIEK